MKFARHYEQSFTIWYLHKTYDLRKTCLSKTSNVATVSYDSAIATDCSNVLDIAPLSDLINGPLQRSERARAHIFPWRL